MDIEHSESGESDCLEEESKEVTRIPTLRLPLVQRASQQELRIFSRHSDRHQASVSDSVHKDFSTSLIRKESSLI